MNAYEIAAIIFASSIAFGVIVGMLIIAYYIIKDKDKE